MSLSQDRPRFSSLRGLPRGHHESKGSVSTTAISQDIRAGESGRNRFILATGCEGVRPQNLRFHVRQEGDLSDQKGDQKGKATSSLVHFAWLLGL